MWVLGYVKYHSLCNINTDAKITFSGCFDEFNRLQEETLSAIAMLIQPLQAALKDKCDVVSLLNKNVSLV